MGGALAAAPTCPRRVFLLLTENERGEAQGALGGSRANTLAAAHTPP